MPILGLFFCQGGLIRAQDSSVWDANVNPAEWWEDSAWNNRYPRLGDRAWFPDGEDNPTRSAFLSLPDSSVYSWQTIEAILQDNFRWRVIGDSNPLTYILGDIEITSRGNQGQFSEHYMMNAGFINNLNHSSGGGPYIQRFGQRSYGLETGNVEVGRSGDPGIAKNRGLWHIGGNLNIAQNSEFTNLSYVEVTGITTLQSGALLKVQAGTFRGGRISVHSASSIPLYIGERVNGNETSAKLLLRDSLLAPHIYMSGGATLDVDGSLGVGVFFDTDRARDPASGYGNIIRTGSTFIGGSGTMELGKSDRFSADALDIDSLRSPEGNLLGGGGKFSAESSLITISGTATVHQGADFWSTDSSLNVGTLSVGGGATLSGKAYQNGSTPDIMLGQIDVTGWGSLHGWVRAGGLSSSLAGSILVNQNSRLELTGSAQVRGNGSLTVSGSNALLAGSGMNLSGAATGNPASLSVRDYGQVVLTGDLTTGMVGNAGKSSLSASGLGGLLKARRLDFGVAGGSTTNLTISNSATVEVTNGMNLNKGNFTDNVSVITIGGDDGQGGFHSSGLLVSADVTKAPNVGTATLNFRHRDSGGALFWPALNGVDIIESTGPGRTVLRGRVTDADLIRADAGTLEINHADAANTLILGTQVRGGNLVVRGSQLLVDPAGLSGTSVTGGTLSVVEGGFLRSALTISGTAGNFPEVIVDGFGSSILAQKSFSQVGNAGNGLLTIRNGGKVTCEPGNSLWVGGLPGSNGTVRVTSLGELHANQLSVGQQGTGFLDLVTAGIAKISGSTVIGHSAGGLAQVGPLSNLQADGGLTVGHQAKGDLRIRGGTVRVGPTGQGTLVLGGTSYGDGSVWFEDDGGTLFASGISTGEDGVGSIIFNHTAPNLMFRTSISGAMSVFSRKGTTTFDLPAADVSMLEVSGGTLNIANGTHFSAFGDIIVGKNDYFSDNGILIVSGAGTVCENYARPIEIRMMGGLVVNEGARVICGEGGGPITLGRADEPGSAGWPGGVLIIGGTVPGIIEASAVKALGPLDADPAYWSTVIFRHGSPGYEFSVPLQGNLVLNHEGPGTTVIPGAMTHAGGTNVTGGQLILNGSSGSGDSIVKNTGKLGGTGTLRDVFIEAGGTLSPGNPTAGGNPIGRLRSTRVTGFRPGGKFEVGIGDWTGNTGGTHWDQLIVSQLSITATAASPFVIKVTGPAANFSETAKSMTIVTRTGGAAIPNPLNVVVDASDFPGTGTWTVTRSTSTLGLSYTPGTETPYQQWARLMGLTEANSGPAQDADNDGLNNLAEFALDENPRNGGGGKRAHQPKEIGGANQVVFTLPVRRNAVFGGTPALVSGVVDGVIYRIEASDDLSAWTVPVIEVTGAEAEAAQAGLRPLSNANWSYRTFRTSGAASAGRRFIRVRFPSP